ncbi:hypothetical protein ASPVEDRAFT_855179 [Aspergillus versicolor CBS 583.65]|uniref:Uncharacterized protein n=1 Tax=Aspergillus versicolor CBS 583.65 TaxID=1036611 RepID=A0A1L9PVD0_ASPVE|nr:uncharacterized protein ASPVEDRAFT_855179 [Aspergillus versicolor CBS 583.65]OJJ05481.1 hypothetical protein ASPVEDRAFT_855179 [Aspergillus versicolor CBS 583.65]
MEEFISPTDISEPSNGPDKWSAYVEENPVEPDGVTQDINTADHGYNWRETDEALMHEISSGPTVRMVEGCVFDTDKEMIEFFPGQFVAGDAFKPTLIALADKKTDAVKDFCGTQRRNAQFCLIRGNDPRDKRLLPATWAVKDNGVNVRAQVRGGNSARELAIEFVVYLQGSPEIPSARQSARRTFTACHTPETLFYTFPARTRCTISST